MSSGDEDDGEAGEVPAVEIPIDGVLDLHAFAPRDVADVVREYVEVCRERGILELRLIHGKGIGVQRRIVEGVLERHPAVRSFRGGDETSGGWGATLVSLHPAGEEKK